MEVYCTYYPARLETEKIWCDKFGYLPQIELRNIQKICECKDIDNKIVSIRNSLDKKVDKSRFLANYICESGAWLQALPSPQHGTHFSNDEFRIALSLRLAAPIVQPHIYICGDRVNKFAHHGLSCGKVKEQIQDIQRRTTLFNVH